MAASAVGARTALPVLTSSTRRRPADPPGLGGDRPLGQTTMAGIERNVSIARAFVREMLGKDHPLTGTACLVVSELVTNAVQHSRSGRPGGTVTVVLREAGPAVRIAVADQGAPDSIPVLKNDCCGTSGRGLLLVDALAESWGYTRGRRGTTVWCHLTA